MAAVRWWLGLACPKSSALQPSAWPGTAEAGLSCDASWPGPWLSLRGVSGLLLPTEVSPPDLQTRGSKAPKKAQAGASGTCGFGPDLVQPHCCPIRSVTVTPAPAQTHCGRPWMPGGAFHWGIFEDNAPGPHQRRTKSSLSSSPKPAGARGEEDRPGAAGDGAGLRGTPPPARPGQWPGHPHLRLLPHPCSPARLPSPELRARAPRFDSRKPGSSDPAG